jgi:hypothetical protein
MGVIEKKEETRSVNTEKKLKENKLTNTLGNFVHQNWLRARIDLLVRLDRQLFTVRREVASVIAIRHRALERVIFPAKDVVCVVTESRAEYAVHS